MIGSPVADTVLNDKDVQAINFRCSLVHCHAGNTLEIAPGGGTLGQERASTITGKGLREERRVGRAIFEEVDGQSFTGVEEIISK